MQRVLNIRVKNNNISVPGTNRPFCSLSGLFSQPVTLNIELNGPWVWFKVTWPDPANRIVFLMKIKTIIQSFLCVKMFVHKQHPPSFLWNYLIYSSHVGVRLGQKFKAYGKNLVGNINILVKANINTKTELLSLEPPGTDYIPAGLGFIYVVS